MKSPYIFDMDGTLFKTHLILEPALEETFSWLREQSLWSGPTPLEMYQRIMGVPLPVVWETLCPDHSDEQRQTSNAHFQQALINEITRRNGSLYEGVELTLAELSKTHPLHIASNGNMPYLQAIVSTYQLDRFITTINSIDRIPSGNKSELVATIVNAYEYSEGFVVGDRLSDIQAAKDNGLQAIGVRFDFAQEEELQQANKVIDHFSELLAKK